MKIFISSVQKEFATQRKALAEYLSGDPLLRRFFETFLFERDVPASDRRPDAVYLDEVRNCDLYLGLFGDDYGRENQDGLSPTHLEYAEATRLGKTRLIFIKGATDEAKHPRVPVEHHKNETLNLVTGCLEVVGDSGRAGRCPVPRPLGPA